MTDPIPVLDACIACGNIVRTEERVEAKGPDGKDVILHEVCFLRDALLQEQHRSKVWGDLLRAIVHHLGDVVTVGLGDVARGAQAGDLSSRQEGDRITLWVGEPRRIVLAGSLPKGLPAPRT